MASTSAWSASGMTTRSSVTTTLETFSPCTSPGCEYCIVSQASATTSPSSESTSQSSSWSIVSSTPASPTADAMSICEPSADVESSSLVHEMMNAARAKAGRSTSKLVPIVDPNNLPPNPETLDFSERIDAAIAKSSALIAEAQAQLAAPKVAPKALTVEEKIEARRNSA